jgi:CheY-like chemotaxis protein
VELLRRAPVGRAQVGRAGAQVLLVEDGEETRKGLAEMLSLLGYSVVAAASGEEALACREVASVDLLLTDYMLPGITGAELSRSLLERRPDLRVIVMSGYAAEDAVPGDDDRVRFLAKPFGMAALAAEVRAALAPATPSA